MHGGGIQSWWRTLAAPGAGGEATAGVLAHLLDSAAKRRRYELALAHQRAGIAADYVLAASVADAAPDTAFSRLRWGGQLVLHTHRPRLMQAMLEPLRRRPEFHLEVQPHRIADAAPRWALWRRPPIVAVVRKVMIEKPDDLTVRHSHDLRLLPDAGDQAVEGYVVSKSAPGLETTMQRLLKVRPTLSPAQARQIATKLVSRVFPVFLTREAAFLKIIRRRMPGHLQPRVPALVRMEQDERGFVRRLDMTWLRLGGRVLSTLEFARQAATMLHALHHHAGVLHLDLRLENLIMTEQGVGVIDFGSSMQAGEDIARNALLEQLFTEVLGSSRPCAQLRRLQGTGLVTSNLFTDCYARRTPAIDLFCLAWYMTRPQANPDFRGLVSPPTDDEQATLRRVQRLTLAPSDPRQPTVRSVRDVLDLLQGVWADAPVAPSLTFAEAGSASPGDESDGHDALLAIDGRAA